MEAEGELHFKANTREDVMSMMDTLIATRTLVGLNFEAGAMQTVNAVFVEGQAATIARVI